MLREALNESLVIPGLEADTIEEAVDRLLDRMCATGKVKNRALARADILKNEQRMSTGMQHGIAVPHAKSDAVDELVAAVATTRVPLEIPGPGREKARIVICILSAHKTVGPHLRFLAEIGRLLKQRELRERLSAASTGREMLDVLAS